MAVYKDGSKWRVIYRFTNWKGERKQTQKRGFATKREAQRWEREILLKQGAKLDMTFGSFFEIYEADKKKRVKENTWEAKSHVIRTKILPYFKERKMEEIEPKDVIAWQNEMLTYRGEHGEVYSPTYLKTMHAQLSAIFNHAVRFYHLSGNPAQKAGSMGSEEHREMLFWTKEEYLKFADAMRDKPRSYYAFEMLYWCGIRLGELLALVPSDFDFERNTVTISKSYQRLKGKDVITSPKTVKSNRTIKMPQFLCEEMKEYIHMLYEIGEKERLFQITKSYLHHEMPIVEGLIYAGTYLFVGSPKVGKSFLMAQLGYHVSMGIPLWDYVVRKGTVLYLALEDDYARLQKRLSRMFGMESSENFYFATQSKHVSGGLEQQLEQFVKEHENARLIIIDTLQKVREIAGDSFSYASDYEIVTRLKKFSDQYGVCLLVVHHTRKMESADSFDMISGTNGLLGAADGAFVMQKEKRTGNKASLEIAGRDQQDQKLFLDFDREQCIWKFVKAETELWKEPADPVLEAVASILSEEQMKWSGSASELLQLLPEVTMQPNVFTRKLNISTERLLLDYGIAYENRREHKGRRIWLQKIKEQA